MNELIFTTPKGAEIAIRVIQVGDTTPGYLCHVFINGDRAFRNPPHSYPSLEKLDDGRFVIRGRTITGDAINDVMVEVPEANLWSVGCLLDQPHGATEMVNMGEQRRVFLETGTLTRV